MEVLTIAPVQYLVGEDGEKQGVVLGWQEYKALQSFLVPDPDLLYALSEAELQSLAEGMLAAPYQTRLNHLLEKQSVGDLSAPEMEELDALLERVDTMNLLKARALYTLEQEKSHVVLRR